MSPRKSCLTGEAAWIRAGGHWCCPSLGPTGSLRVWLWSNIEIQFNMRRPLAYFNRMNTPDPEHAHAHAHTHRNQCKPSLREPKSRAGWCTVKGARQRCLCMSQWWPEEVDNLRCVNFYAIYVQFWKPRLNEQWNIVIFITSEVILRLLLHPKLLIVIYLGSLLNNYGHFTCQWSRFSKVAVKIIVWMPESAVPLTVFLLFSQTILAILR